MRPIGLAEGNARAHEDQTTGHDRCERGRVSAATASRQAGFTGEIVVVGAEPHPPQERPPLSKRLVDVDNVASALSPIVPADQLRSNQIEPRLGRRAHAIDPSAGTVLPDHGGERRWRPTACCSPPAPARADSTFRAVTWRQLLPPYRRRRPPARAASALAGSPAGRRCRLRRAGGGRGRTRAWPPGDRGGSLAPRSEEHTSELQSRGHLVCRLLLEKKKKKQSQHYNEKKKKKNNKI